MTVGLMAWIGLFEFVDEDSWDLELPSGEAAWKTEKKLDIGTQSAMIKGGKLNGRFKSTDCDRHRS